MGIHFALPPVLNRHKHHPVWDYLSFVNNMGVQETSFSMSIAVERNQCMFYRSNMVTVYMNCDTTTTPVAVFHDIQTLRVHDPQTSTIRMFMGSAPSPFQGSGRFFYDGMDGFYTTSMPLVDAIRSVESGSRSNVNIVRRPNSMGTPVAAMVSGDTTLLTVDPLNTNVIMVAPDEGVLYRAGEVAIVEAVPVPKTSTVQFVGNTVQIRNPEQPGTNRDIMFMGTTVFIQDFPGATTYPQVIPPSQMFGNGGVLYFGQDGVLFARDQRIFSELYNRVDALSGISQRFQQTMLNFYDGKIIRMFNTSADMVLFGPGTVYSTTDEAFFVTDPTLNS